ncbi:hypothetical protein [Jeotgalibacillus marinus]|uniref:Uncharacterized protein n=1 Tax=Jeotgalibacillus marinus TaxID=86667 RepID=A0ABV3Q0R2_9BACL
MDGLKSPSIFYYQTTLKTVLAEIGPYRSTLIGHMTLVQNFSDVISLKRLINEIFAAINKRGYEFDYNGTGFGS